MGTATSGAMGAVRTLVGHEGAKVRAGMHGSYS